MKRIFTTLALLCSGVWLMGEVIPPAPKSHIEDRSGNIAGTTAEQINQQLQQFERDTSCQVVVAIFSTMESDAPIADYTLRVAQSWGVGQAGENNGVVMFVFVHDRKMYIQVGRGLEATLPNALCQRIIDEEVLPCFRREDYEGGVQAGVTGIMKALQGKYKGSLLRRVGKTIWRDDGTGQVIAFGSLGVLLVLGGFVLYRMRRQALLFGGTGTGCCHLRHNYWRHGYRPTPQGSPYSGSSSGVSASSGGNYSSGGGSFAGGGAGGSW